MADEVVTELTPQEMVDWANAALDRQREQQEEIQRLRAALERNVQERHRYKHIDAGHHCGWRVIAEAMIERSKEAIRDD